MPTAVVARYVTWSAGVEVRVGRVSDGSLVARTSTHETLTCLDCSMDAGYVVVAGRKDGRLLTMKLLLDNDHRLRETTARDAEERRRILLHQLVYNLLTYLNYFAIYVAVCKFFLKAV